MAKITVCGSVNLGGLFVLEPFISPALFQKYPGTVDEWTLSEAMAADTASGGLNQLEDHYNTFIVRGTCMALLLAKICCNRRKKTSRRLLAPD